MVRVPPKLRQVIDQTAPHETGQRRAVVYCASLFELRIFLRLRRQMADRGWTMVLVTARLSVWWLARRHRTECVLLRPTSSANPFGASLRAALETARGGQDNAVIVQWNGSRGYGKITTAYARERGLATIYFELGNISPKLFVDPWGVNGSAWLAHYPEALDSLFVDETDIHAWKQSVVTKRLQSQPPQTSTAAKINPWFLLDYVGALVLRVPQPQPFRVLQKISGKLRTWVIARPPALIPDRPYVLFPMQVHDEINTGADARQEDRAALASAALYAQERGLQLVVKSHPVETDTALLRDVQNICLRDGHLFTSENTTRLVQGAVAVVTINSSVGLEALLLDKPVVALGDALFKDFTPHRVALFAMRYLLDFDPFSDSEISDAAADVLVTYFDRKLPAE